MLRGKLTVLPALLAIGLLPACQGSTTTTGDGATPSGSAVSETESPVGDAPESKEPEPGGGDPVTIAFLGDMHAEGGVGAALRNDPKSLLAGVKPALDKADLVVGNVETAITEGGDAAPKKYNFRAPASFLTALKEGGLDVANVANNHGMDYGASGLQDTLAAGKATNMPIIGAGQNEAEAYAPYVTEIKGQKIAVIGATQVLDASFLTSWTAGPDKPGLANAKKTDLMVEAVKKAKAEADTVVVFLHWGTERMTCPNEAQRSLEKELKAAGAQVIVGSHAHVVLGGGYDGDTFVNYGLGNFLFYSGGRTNGQEQTGVQLVTVDAGKVTGAEWLPGKIRGNDLPSLYEGQEKAAADAKWEQKRECTGLAATPS